MTPDAVKRSIDALLYVAEDSGLNVHGENLELWVKPGWYLICVSVGYDDDDHRSHRSQMEMDGWQRRA